MKLKNILFLMLVISVLIFVSCISEKQKEIDALEKYIANSSMELRTLASELENSEIAYAEVSGSDTLILKSAKEYYMMAVEQYQTKIENVYFAQQKLNSLSNEPTTKWGGLTKEQLDSNFK
jgi:hypothetical protein